MQPGDSAASFYDASGALSFLAQFLADPVAMTALRGLAPRGPQTPCVSRFSDHDDVLRHLAWELAEEQDV